MGRFNLVVSFLLLNIFLLTLKKSCNIPCKFVAYFLLYLGTFSWFMHNFSEFHNPSPINLMTQIPKQLCCELLDVSKCIQFYVNLNNVEVCCLFIFIFFSLFSVYSIYQEKTAPWKDCDGSSSG